MDRTPTDTRPAAERLRAIQLHLASFLPAKLLERFWHDGFGTVRQPSFRLNALRLRDGSADATATSSSSSAVEYGRDFEHGEDAVRELLDGFGVSPNTPLERCPYYPLARLLPPHTAAVVRVADRAHSLGPLKSGAVYFMGLSSMLPALVLLAQQQQHHHHHQQQQQQQQQQRQQALPPSSTQRPASQRRRLAQETDREHRAVGSVRGGGRGSDAGSGSGALRVLDLCAAPGGKTALMAELLANQGTLLAVDASWPRLQRLQFNLDRLVPNQHNAHYGFAHDSSCSAGGGSSVGALPGASVGVAAAAASRPWWRRGCVVAVHADGTRLRVDEHGLPLVHVPARNGGHRGGSRRRSTEYDTEDDDEGEIGVYDRVLVDAPCSGLGRLQLHRPSSYSRWDKQQVALHPERQRRLLLRGAKLLRRGGSLVYSTCTIDPRENEAVVAWALRHVGSLRLVEPRLSGPWVIPGQLPQSPRELCVNTGSPAVSSAASVGAGPSAAAAAAASVNLREALEAHRPGCTYPALLDGSWWGEAAGVSGAGGRCRVTDGGAGSAGAPPSLGGGVGGTAAMMWRGLEPVAGTEWLRTQLESCCVRVAPGPTYEGFFLAQFVKD